MIASPLLLTFVLGNALSEVFSYNPQSPSAMDYFGRIFLTMSVFYSALLSAWTMGKERSNHTLNRQMCSPVKDIQFLSGVFFAVWITTLIIALSIMAGNAFLLKITIGMPFPVILLMAGAAFFSASMGLFFSLLIPDNGSYIGFLSGLIPLFIFLGGGYFPIPEQGIINTLSRFSPFRWILICLHMMAVQQQTGPLGITLIILFGSGMVLFLISVLKTVKRGLK